MTRSRTHTLATCSQNTPDNGGGGDQAFKGVFFKTIEEQAPGVVIVEAAEVKLADGLVSGSMQGSKQSYNAKLQLSFTGGTPSYTASGTFNTVASKIFTEQPMILSTDVAYVGKFILGE